MVKSRRKIKIKWKNLLAGLLAFLAIVGSVVGIAALAGKKTKKVYATAFSRGAIDADGNYVESNQSVYTKNFIECQGLTIKPDYEARGTYQVFYYTEGDVFIGATEVMNANEGVYTKDGDFPLAKYARIVITPDASAYTDDGEEFKIRFWQAAKYARDYTIIVDRKQVYNLTMLLEGYENKFVFMGEGIWDNVGGTGFKQQTAGFYFFEEINVENSAFLVIKVKNESLKNSISYTDGQVFEVPYLYSNDGEKVSVVNEPYYILAVVGEYSYVAYDVSPYSSVFGFVDVISVDCCEIYVV